MSIDQLNPIIICRIRSYLAVDVGVSLIVARTALGQNQNERNISFVLRLVTR